MSTSATIVDLTKLLPELVDSVDNLASSTGVFCTDSEGQFALMVLRDCGDYWEWVELTDCYKRGKTPSEEPTEGNVIPFPKKKKEPKE